MVAQDTRGRMLALVALSGLVAGSGFRVALEFASVVRGAARDAPAVRA